MKTCIYCTKDSYARINDEPYCELHFHELVQRRIKHECVDDTYLTSEAICPWCGLEQYDDPEDRDGVWNCWACENEFNLERDYTVYYITSKHGKNTHKAYVEELNSC